MDLGTIVAAASSSLGLSLAGAYWLARALIQNRLTEALEQRKSELSRQLEMALGVNNATGQKAYESHPYPGRTLFAELRFAN